MTALRAVPVGTGVLTRSRAAVRLRRVAPTALIAVMLAASLPGCSLFGSTARVTPPLKAEAGLQTLQARWHLDLSDGQVVPLSAAVDGGRIFAAKASGELQALNATSGSQVWKVTVPDQLAGGVGAGEHLVAVGTRHGKVVVFDEDGHPLWDAVAGVSAITAPPVIADGVVVVRTGEGKLVAFTAANGAKRWSVERALPALTLYRASSAVAAHGALFVGLPGGKLLALTLDQGKVGWESAVAVPRGATELERVADVTGTPVVGERDVCAATYQGRVACLNPTNGNPLWSREVSSLSGLGADSGRVYVADEKGAVSAWERGSGSPAWKNEDLNGRRLIGAVAAAGLVITGDLQGYVHWLDRSDGKITARASTDGSSLFQAPIFLGDGVLVQTRKGGLFVFPMP